jgi:aspartate/methionine/tyrosine aminotransferase
MTNVNDLTETWEAMHGFRSVPRTGVIFVTTEAFRRGYRQGHSEWVNLGQGAPETGTLEGAPDRLLNLSWNENDLEYAPVDGVQELRDAVARLYNERFRAGCASQYTRENVAIAAGGRVALTRIIAALGRCNVGHFLPDYTAYEELLSAVQSFVPIPVLRPTKRGERFSVADLQREIHGRGLSAFLLSNPANPTGEVINGDDLRAWVDTAREYQCSMIFDEFYAHYVYDTPEMATLSAARYVNDVNSDPIIIVDGLTKNWRCPAFRVSWTVAPKAVIEAVTSAGSFLDGGCARPMQLAALQLVDSDGADREASAIQKAFRIKRQFMISNLRAMGIEVHNEDTGAFYCWGDLSGLPEGLRTGMDFFHRALDRQVIVVPGSFFDIDPGGRRRGRGSRFDHFVRFSFGPSMSELERAVMRLRALIQEE